MIDAAWEARDGLGTETGGEVRDAVERGARACSIPARRASPRRAPDGWTVNQWLKKAVLLSFRLNPMAPIAGGPGGAIWWDKVPSKFLGWTERAISPPPASAPCPARSSAAAPSSAGTRC